MDRSFFKNVTLLQRKPVVFATVNDISIICSCTYGNKANSSQMSIAGPHFHVHGDCSTGFPCLHDCVLVDSCGQKSPVL
jgi:hypothetical protein